MSSEPYRFHGLKLEGGAKPVETSLAPGCKLDAAVDEKNLSCGTEFDAFYLVPTAFAYRPHACSQGKYTLPPV